MKVLSWNARGLGNPRGFCTLQDLLKREAPDLVFLQKTKVSASYFITYMLSYGFPNCLAVHCEGKSGGLVLMWKKEIPVDILQYSKNHIHGLITIVMREKKNGLIQESTAPLMLHIGV